MTAPSTAPSTAWARALEEHRASVAALVRTIEATPEDRWLRPARDGKWTPAQISEHLALTYEVAAAELAGAPSLRPKLTPLRRRLLRWVLLPHVLFHRTLPIPAPAPRELRPSETGLPLMEAGSRLRELAGRFEEAALAAGTAGSAGLEHPYFGRIPPLRSLRFVTIHLEHHTRHFPVSATNGR